MITLHHGCWMSEPSVFPANWMQPGASIKIPWRIQYYFHDPAFSDDPLLKNGKLRIIKGMNKFTNISQRRSATKLLIDEEKRFLLEEGYNPITKLFNREIEINTPIHPYTPFLKALAAAYGLVKCSPNTMADIRTVLKYFSMAAEQLNFDKLPVKDIRRKHVKMILEHCQHVKKYWSENQFNVYRKYIRMLFVELTDLEACDYNPVKEIGKKKTVSHMRLVLTHEERIKIDAELKLNHYHFWRFLQIFFHSGGRITELFRIKKTDIDIKNQRYKSVIKKGKVYNETWRPVKNIVLHLWNELLNEADPNDFLFSTGLVPGSVAINPKQISRRWQVHVKKKMGITADFYSLKHLNLDETAEALSIQDAARMAGHTTPVITLKHYTFGEKQRQLDRLKDINNPFA